MGKLLNFPMQQPFDAAGLAKVLSHDDMIVLARAFQRWAVEEPRLTLKDRADFAAWSESLQSLSKTVGPDWQPRDPASSSSMMKATAHKLHNEPTGHIHMSRMFRRSEWQWSLPEDKHVLTITQKAERLALKFRAMAAEATPDRKAILLKQAERFATVARME